MSLTLRKLKRDNLKSQTRKITQTSPRLRITSGDAVYFSMYPSIGSEICNVSLSEKQTISLYNSYLLVEMLLIICGSLICLRSIVVTNCACVQIT